MKPRDLVLILIAALIAAILGLVASIAINGPGPLLRSELGQHLVGWWLREPAPAGMRIDDIGDRVVAIRLPALQGIRLAAPATGQATLVNYWASWCGPCREEMPLLDAYARQQGAGGVQVITIALDQRADALDFLAEHPVSLPVLLETPSLRDSSVRLGNHSGVLPFTALIGADGRLRDRHVGAFKSAQDLQDWVEQAR